MRFPENPPDGDKFNYRGRIFRWVSKPEFDCGGMWVSEGASQSDDTIIDQNPLWKDVVEKPDAIMDLGVGNRVRGSRVTIQTRQASSQPSSLAPGELAVVEQTKELYAGTTMGGVIKIGGGGANTWDELEEKPEGISNLGYDSQINGGSYNTALKERV